MAPEGAEETGPETGVDCPEEEGHHPEGGVAPPVRDGPGGGPAPRGVLPAHTGRSEARSDLVGLAVASDIGIG